MKFLSPLAHSHAGRCWSRAVVKGAAARRQADLASPLRHTAGFCSLKGEQGRRISRDLGFSRVHTPHLQTVCS